MFFRYLRTGFASRGARGVRLALREMSEPTRREAREGGRPDVRGSISAQDRGGLVVGDYVEDIRVILSPCGRRRGDDE